MVSGIGGSRVMRPLPCLQPASRGRGSPDPRRVTKTGSAQTGDPATDPAADDTNAEDPAADADTDPAQADQQD